jgi:hypothetical protein
VPELSIHIRFHLGGFPLPYLWTYAILVPSPARHSIKPTVLHCCMCQPHPSSSPHCPWQQRACVMPWGTAGQISQRLVHGSSLCLQLFTLRPSLAPSGRMRTTHAHWPIALCARYLCVNMSLSIKLATVLRSPSGCGTRSGGIHLLLSAGETPSLAVGSYSLPLLLP